MAATTYKLAGVPFDLCKVTIPNYRGAMARDFGMTLSLARYEALDKAITSKKGIVDLEITCSGASGTRARKTSRTIKGLRVLELIRKTDRTCFVRMVDPRYDLSEYIAKANLNLRFRDGLIDGTQAPTLAAALSKLLGPESLSLFEGLDKVPTNGEIEARNTAGYARPKTIDDVCDQHGVDVVWLPLKGKLGFATRDDIGKKPLKHKHFWVLGHKPGWEIDKRKQYRLPKKLRYYYTKRHMMVVPIVHDAATVSSVNPLQLAAVQVYDDGGKFLTLTELLAKYAPGKTITDAKIAESFMSENFEGTAIARDGSADIDTLLRILKADWSRLFRLVAPHGKGAFGGLSDLVLGVFKKAEVADIQRGVKAGDVTEDIDDVGGVRGNWAEFLNVLTGGKITEQGITGLTTVTNHVSTAPLPTMPFGGEWANEEAGVLRLRQQRLPDNNFAMPGRVSNADDMKVTWVPRRTVKDPVTGNAVPTRWGFDAPSRDKAKLRIDPMYLIVAGTQRWPNDAAQFQMHEFDGWADGNADVQEFEVSEKLALYDFVDIDGKIDGELHPADSENQMGTPLNNAWIREDAEARAEMFREEMGRSFAGEGVGAGITMLDEVIDGAVDQINIEIDGVAVYGRVVCDNLATDAARKRRAVRRAEARKVKVGKKEVA